jgi:hypothetical protein
MELAINVLGRKASPGGAGKAVDFSGVIPEGTCSTENSFEP